jgi:hypothetical protein
MWPFDEFVMRMSDDALRDYKQYLDEMGLQGYDVEERDKVLHAMKKRGMN